MQINLQYDSEKEIVSGFDFTKPNLKAIFSQFKGKVFVMEFSLQKRSSLSNNYHFAVIKAMADEIGYSVENLRNEVLKRAFVHHLLGNDHPLDTNRLVVKIVDFSTAEERPVLLSTSKFTDTEMSYFTDFCIKLFKEYYPKWVEPDPALYKGKRRGNSNDVLVDSTKKTKLS